MSGITRLLVALPQGSLFLHVSCWRLMLRDVLVEDNQCSLVPVTAPALSARMCNTSQYDKYVC